MINVQDVWPENLVPDSIDHSAPIVVLRAQASFLATKTKGIVTAVVDSLQGKTQRGEVSFEHTLSLVAPLLGYRTPLLRVTHGMGDYPVDVYDMASASSWTTKSVANQEGLLEELRRIFSSVYCRQVVSNYVTQSMASESDASAA